MVFAARRTCVLEDSVSVIQREDGYRGTSHPMVGDVAVYRSREGDVQHVGLVVEIRQLIAGFRENEIMVLSKWGADGEYLHRRDDVPEIYGRFTEYWTERQETP
jgi:hypothetical protein